MQLKIKLNDYSVKSLNAISEQLQSAVETAIGESDSLNADLKIKEQCKRVLCRAREWKSDAFFVIVVGPVKSGKSTFVNLLAHEHVSPTHFLECTVRPSIISRKNEEDQPSMITPFITEEEPSIEHVDSIIDHVKGLEFADLSNIAKDTPCVLNQENLDKKVAHRIGLDISEKGKVALTSITANGGEFLQDNIYLIDMPGFDGVQANLNQAFYEAIVNRADLVVFVQSSNSAINKISEDFCSIIQKRNGSVPIFFIHNYFDSAYWHTEADRQRVTDGHIEKALDFFDNQKLVVKQENCYRINLGKVTDARDRAFLDDTQRCIPEYIGMLETEEKSFEMMEQDLHEKISSSQSKMRLQNCINRTIREIEILGELLHTRQAELLHMKQEYDNLNILFNQLKDSVKLLTATSILNVGEKKKDLISQLKDIQKQFSNNIDHTKKYNTDSTREKARELITIYKASTESFVKSIFNPMLIQQNVCSAYNKSFMEAIPIELKTYTSLFADIRLAELSITIDCSSIDKVYDVNKKIEKWNIKTRKGADVIEHMIDVEHALFGLSPEQPCGFIPQYFFSTLQTDITEWIGTIIQNYYDACMSRIEETRSIALAEIIPDIERHEKEVQETERLLKGIRIILESMNQQNGKS